MKICIIHIKHEIKFLYHKKQQIKKELYKTHIQVANQQKNIWQNIEESINEKLNKDA